MLTARRKSTFVAPTSTGLTVSGLTGKSGKLNSDFLTGLSVNFKSSGFRKFIAQYQQVNATFQILSQQ
jgi:hypothetical protein